MATSALAENNGFSRFEKYLYFALSLTLWFYIVLRAWKVPLTHDEVANFFHYVSPGDIWPGDKTLWDANNHILNTYLTRFSYLLFGGEEWALRLPTVLLAGVYFLFTYKLASKLKQPLIRWSLVLALLFAHVVIEFLALTRGYGISLGFMLAGLYYAYAYIEKPRMYALILTAVFLVLAVFANLNLLILLLMVVVFLIAKAINESKNHKGVVWHVIVLLGIVAVPVRFFIGYGFNLKERGKLYYGGEESFWKDTVTSVMEYIAWDFVAIGNVVLVILFLLIIALLIKSLKPNIDKILAPEMLFPYLLIGLVISSILIFHFLGTLYQLDRTALHYYPLFVLSLVFLLDKSSIRYRKQLAALILTILSFFPIHFISKLNTSYSSLWYHDESTRRFLEIIIEHSGMQNHLTSISGYHLRGFPLMYHNRIRANGFFNQMTPNSSSDGETDYQIIGKEECEKCDLYDSLAYHERSGLYLMKRKKFMRHETLLTIEGVQTEGEKTDGEYLVTQKIQIDSLIGQDLELEYKWTMDMPESTRLWLIFDIIDDDGKSYRYDFMGANWPKRRFAGEKDNFHYAVLLPNIPEGATTINTYLWNGNRELMSVKDGVIKLNRLKEPDN